MIMEDTQEMKELKAAIKHCQEKNIEEIGKIQLPQLEEWLTELLSLREEIERFAVLIKKTSQIFPFNGFV